MKMWIQIVSLLVLGSSLLTGVVHGQDAPAPASAPAPPTEQMQRLRQDQRAIQQQIRAREDALRQTNAEVQAALAKIKEQQQQLSAQLLQLRADEHRVLTDADPELDKLYGQLDANRASMQQVLQENRTQTAPKQRQHHPAPAAQPRRQ